MLRTVVLVLGAAMIAGAAAILAALPHLWPLALQLFLFGVLILAGIVFERHYRGRTATRGIHLQQTGERFIDPTSGKLTEVFYDPKTGERIYKEVSR